MGAERLPDAAIRERADWLRAEEDRERLLFEAWFARAWWAGGAERRRKDGPHGR